MKTCILARLSEQQFRKLLLRPGRGDATSDETVAGICTDVRKNGDSAVRKYTRRFDRTDVHDFRVSTRSIQAAGNSVPRELRKALQVAASNIRKFHQAQRQSERVVTTTSGVSCWRERRPIDSVGLYVPAGSAPLPSTVLMLGIPALLAGCREIVLCSPPTAGGMHPTILAAADIVGIRTVFAVGGAQAIAAMAYGTESIPRVSKIFGPGNRFVTAAKRFVSSDPRGVATDMVAGPSELLIIADDSALPDVVVADLLSQAEHDPEALVGLVTTSRVLIESVRESILQRAKELPRKDILRKSLKNAFCVLADTLEQAVAFSNDFSPEHLILNTKTPKDLVPSIRNAGSIFIGPFSPVTAGDYASGTNHTLPTGSTARYFSGLSVESFEKTLSFQFLTQNGLRTLAPTLITLARTEGLEAHAQAVLMRASQSRASRARRGTKR
ncbi:MAG: histidinol dehydrogenase [Bacteroidota bacterium]